VQTRWDGEGGGGRRGGRLLDERGNVGEEKRSKVQVRQGQALWLLGPERTSARRALGTGGFLGSERLSRAPALSGLRREEGRRERCGKRRVKGRPRPRCNAMAAIVDFSPIFYLFPWWLAASRSPPPRRRGGKLAGTAENSWRACGLS
jgi:hypothetical protein